jgi:5-methyltetrahydrofolate corrinoid/iron sulfur protein methyltransferase
MRIAELFYRKQAAKQADHAQTFGPWRRQSRLSPRRRKLLLEPLEPRLLLSADALKYALGGAVTDLPLLLDTTNPAALAAGLAACGGRAVINGFSLEPAKLNHILPLARRHQVEIVGYLLHPDSRVPHEADEMMALAVALFEAYRALDLDPARLIIDPVIAPLAWPDGTRHNRAVLTLIRQLPELLGTPVRTMAGLSNLASGAMPLARKIALEQAFLPMLAAAGLDLLLVNVMHGPTLDTARICTGLLADGIFAWTPPGG